MTSGSRSRRRHRAPPRPASSSVPSPPPTPMASFAFSSSRLVCKGAAPLSSALLVLTLALVGYITWKEVASIGASSASIETSLSEKASVGGSSHAHRAFGHGTVPLYSFEVVNEYHHDPGAYTQGLLYAGNDTLFESTGLYGESSVRKVHLQTGKVQAIYHMDSRFFGEGLTLLGERLFQVTWLTRTGFIYDQHNLTRLEEFTHQMQDGWGLATDGKAIFGSDGTSTLYQLEPQNFTVIKKATVKYDGRAVSYLNELEYVNGEIWANVFLSDCIARISHEHGEVIGWILLHKLRRQLVESGYTTIDVLNGIAWDKENKRLFVTGKLWPKLYEIKLQKFSSPPSGTVNDLCQLRLDREHGVPNMKLDDLGAMHLMAL